MSRAETVPKVLVGVWCFPILGHREHGGAEMVVVPAVGPTAIIEQRGRT